MQHNQTKITLSKDELELVTNAQILLTKNGIIQKVYQLFGSLAEQYTQHSMEFCGEEITRIHPKISKGENYLGLPYVMLDYPRIFAKDEVFAMRTMFWWGNFFSITLQLKGSYQQHFAPVLISNKKLLAEIGFFVAVSNDEWRHDFEPENYQPLTENGDLLENAIKGDFLKIAVRISLEQWNDAANVLAGYHEMLVRLLADQLEPMR